MASSLFSIGDVVWAKMKGFPAWPGKIVNPTKDVKRPAGKKPMWCVYFFGTDNYAWILEENVKNYLQHKDQHFKKGGRGGPFKEACEAAEEFLKLTPKTEESEQKVLSKPPMVASPVKKRPDLHQLGDIKEGLKRSGVRQMSGSSDETPVKKVKRDDDIVVSKTVQKSPAKFHTSHMNDRDNQMTQIKHRVEQSSPDRITPPPTDMPIYSRNETFASTKPLRFGFLGQGIMGSSMVQNLIKSGHKVVVWNRTSSKCQSAVDAGAHEKDTPADVVAACDITFACVADSAAIREVVSGPNGAASGMTDGKGFVNMSVVDVETSLDISDAITAAGGRFLEAVVTGSRIQAEQKQLIFIAAGDRTLFADCEFCFRAMGKRSIYLGDVGNATRMKIVINMMMGTVIAGMAEGMALAEKCGVNQHDVLEILEMGSMNCGLIRLKGKSIVEGADQENAFQPHFPLKHQQKDLRLALAMGDQVDQPLPITAATNELFKRARSLGYGDQDMAAVYKATFL